MLAGVAVRIEPESAVLRQATADLQKLADSWSAAAVDARARTLGAVIESASREARRALADPAIVLERPR